jgi:hypothetical protein
MEVLDPRASMARKRHDKLVRINVRNPAPCTLQKNQSRGKREELTLCDLRKLIVANHTHIYSAPCNCIRLQEEIRTEACLRGGEGGHGREREATAGSGWWHGGHGVGIEVGVGAEVWVRVQAAEWVRPYVFSDPDEGPS